jgi:hypothetical protein
MCQRFLSMICAGKNRVKIILSRNNSGIKRRIIFSLLSFLLLRLSYRLFVLLQPLLQLLYQQVPFGVPS